MALILLADNDELVGELVRVAMRAQGHEVSVVGDGAEAVRMFESDRPALVILDCSTPSLSGVEALGMIRRSPSGWQTPVLMLSGRQGSRDEEIATRAGASDYLRKPFSSVQLQVRVELLLAMVGYFGFC